MTTYTQTVSDILCLGDVNSQYKKFFNGKDSFSLIDIKYKTFIKPRTDIICLNDFKYKNPIKLKIDNFSLNDTEYKKLIKYKNDIVYLKDINYKNIIKYKIDKYYLTDIQSNIYYKAFVNVIIDTLVGAGIPTIYGQNIKTIDYARWDGVIVRQEESSRDTTYISSYYYNKLSFHLIVASKNRNNYFAYLDAVRQLPLAVKENPYGAVSVVLKPMSGRFDYNVRGIYREEFVLEIQLLY